MPIILLLAPLFRNPLARKAALGVLLVLALMFGLRWYSNRAYSAGRSAGVVASLQESARGAEAGWKTSIDNLQTQITQSQSEASRLSKAATGTLAASKALQEASTAAIAAIPAAVYAVPVADLPAAIQKNDPTITSFDPTPLERDLLASQLMTQALTKQVTDLVASFGEFKTLTDAQIAENRRVIDATQAELKIAQDQRDFYKAQLESATKHRGCGTFKKIVTVGLCR